MSEGYCIDKNHNCNRCTETKKWYGGADVCIHDGNCIHKYNNEIYILGVERIKDKIDFILKKPCRFKQIKRTEKS